MMENIKVLISNKISVMKAGKKENKKRLGRLNAVDEDFNFSFGSFRDCQKILKDAFFTKRPDIKNFKWIPEYDEVAMWLSNTEGEGLLLVGDVGRGKSILLKDVIPYLFKKFDNRVIKAYLATELAENYIALMKERILLIDDIGVERKANDWGEKWVPFMFLMDNAEIKSNLVFITTNLSSNQLSERYGTRILDRMLKLCKVIKFEGESLR